MSTGDAFATCCAALCGIFCICCSDSFGTWCMFKSYGSGSSTSSGVCTSCCKQSFDDDDFEREEARLHAEAAQRERDQNEAAEASERNQPRKSEESRQPAPKEAMSTKPSAEEVRREITAD